NGRWWAVAAADRGRPPRDRLGGRPAGGLPPRPQRRVGRAPREPRSLRAGRGAPMNPTINDELWAALGDADYQKTQRVNVDPETLGDALTNVSALSAWWTRATGSGEAGGQLRFSGSATAA